MATFVSEAEAAAMSLPPTSIVAHARRGLLEFIGPPGQTPSDCGLDIVPGTMFEPSGQKFKQAPLFSPNGRFIAFLFEGSRPIVIADAFSGATVAEIDCTEAITAEFSPLGTYLITWARPKPSAPEEGNQRVWRTETGEVVVQYSQRIYKKNSIQFTEDETYFLRMVTNEVHIHTVASLGTSAHWRLIHRGVTSFGVSPNSANLHVCVFVPAASGNPARLTLLKCPTNDSDAQADIATSSVFSASEANFFWNANGTTVLAHTHADVDSSGSSYYGATRLFILSTTGTSAMVSQSKDGPIYDVSWSPIGDRFAIAAGNMPSHCTMYNESGNATYEFGAAHRNTISWSPHGRFLCIAGFGNLTGAMDFYDTVKMKKIGTNESHCAVSYSWSPDSRYFMTAILTPRMNVDNGIKIFKYNGLGPVSVYKEEHLLSVQWRPAARGVYPNRGQSPKRQPTAADGDAGLPSSSASTTAAVAAPKPKSEPYRPRGSTGALAELIKNEKSGPAVATGKVKPVTAIASAPVGASAVRPSSSSSAAYVPPSRKIPGLVPGAAPAPAANVANNAKKKAAAAPAPAQTQTSPAIAELSAEEKSKRIKALRKKLKAIAEIKEKQLSGITLNEDQRAKLKSEAEIIADIVALGEEA